MLCPCGGSSKEKRAREGRFSMVWQVCEACGFPGSHVAYEGDKIIGLGRGAIEAFRDHTGRVEEDRYSDIVRGDPVRPEGPYQHQLF